MSTTIILILLGLVIAVMSVFLYRQSKRIQQLEKLIDHGQNKLEHLQLNFGRFTPDDVIEHLTEADGSYKANKREVTVLFADLQGFTAMCADLDPEVVVSILNGYFARMGKVITAHHGQVTEMVGDGLLALFGALRPNPWQVQDAVLAALAMRKALEDYNSELSGKGLPRLAFGIGIHKGEVLAGVLGNLELSKFGVVGDAINVASRVEGLTRELKVDLLVTDIIDSELDERFLTVAMPARQVKGKEEPLISYHVKGIRVPTYE